MRIYLTTDTHFYHRSMVQYCGRPENHTEIIGNQFLNFGFTKDDVLIHLGDICIGHDEEAHEKYIMPLPCKKWLLLGNHDHKSTSWYLSHGWDFVSQKFTNVFFGKTILFSHIPQKWNQDYDLNVHGHFHNDTHRSNSPEMLAIKNDKQRLLSIEGTDYLPVLLEKFIQKEVV